MGRAAQTTRGPAARTEAAPRPAARASSRIALPFGGTLQPRLALGPVGDGYERQADAAAAHVTQGRAGAPALSALPMGGGMAQRACAACEEERTGKRIQRKCACGASHDEPCSCGKTEDEHPELQIDRRAKGPGRAAPDPVGAVERVVRAPGRPLPDPVRQDMEAGFGRSFGHVRIHDTPRAAASAEGIGAHAYTVGNHIAFNRGQFRPDTDSGRFLLAHELAHTVQQSGAPAARPPRISQPGDRHEHQANRAADAATTGAPMPALTGGAAPISRYGARDAAGDLAEAATYFYGGPVAGYLFGDDVNEAASDVAGSVIDFGSDVYKTAVAIAEQLGVSVSIDGTTLVIDFDEFDPCSAVDIDFALRLSDIGLDPTLYFPLGPPVPFFTVGIVTLAGMAGIEVNLDPGLGLRADQCSFGPGTIRIDALSGSADISGELSFDVTSMNQLGADLGFRLDTVAIIAWPDPPIVLMVPVIGAALGGSFEFMMQSRSDYTAQFNGHASLGGVSGGFNLDNDVTFVTDMSYGLYGAISVLGMDLCRLGWPLDSWHDESSVNIKVAAAASLGRSGLSFSFTASATALPTDPLGDLGFAFDESRMEDDCWLCEFLFDNGAMPSQNGYTWAGNSANYPLLGGPEADIYQRDPGIGSGALCRGTCGADCADGSCEGERRPLIVCENRGDAHVWHTYEGYETCGSHQGCRDHDACYDMMAETIWGFGGFMLGPGYRACDLDAVCQHGFQTSVGWAGGGGPYDRRLRYADARVETPGCVGPCPEAIASEEDGSEVRQTCLTDRELWPGVTAERRWEEVFFSGNLITGSIPVPYVKRLAFGVNGDIRAAADAFAELGPINLMNACLIYDPATMTYTGTADMTLFANLGASASLTGTLDGFLSDPLCFLNWITLRGYLNAGVIAQLPTDLTAGVDLYCENGDLTILPRVSFQTCLDVKGELNAGLNVYLLSFDVWGREWTLAKDTLLNECWEMNVTFEPFRLGEMPTFNLESAVGALDALLDRMVPVARPRDIDRTPARNPLPAAPSLLFPCMGDDDDDDDDDDGPTDTTCARKATGEDGRRIVPDPDDRGPHWPTTSTLTIPGGGGTDTVGHVMVAPYLEKDIIGGSTPGTQNNIYRHVGLPTAGCFTDSKKKEQHFIKGHLLNHNIGGPGRGENGRKNLFPITEKANERHRDAVEQGGLNVVNRVRADELLYYKVTVQSDLTPREITNPATGVGRGFYEVRSTFLCEVTDYQLCDDDTLRRNPIPPATPITSIFEFTPAGGQPFDTITDPARCHERGPL